MFAIKWYHSLIKKYLGSAHINDGNCIYCLHVYRLIVHMNELDQISLGLCVYTLMAKAYDTHYAWTPCPTTGTHHLINVHDSHSIKVVPWCCRTCAHRKRFKNLWRHLCLGEIVIWKWPVWWVDWKNYASHLYSGALFGWAMLQLLLGQTAQTSYLQFSLVSILKMIMQYYDYTLLILM